MRRVALEAWRAKLTGFGDNHATVRIRGHRFSGRGQLTHVSEERGGGLWRHAAGPFHRDACVWHHHPVDARTLLVEQESYDVERPQRPRRPDHRDRLEPQLVRWRDQEKAAGELARANVVTALRVIVEAMGARRAVAKKHLLGEAAKRDVVMVRQRG